MRYSFVSLLLNSEILLHSMENQILKGEVGLQNCNRKFQQVHAMFSFLIVCLSAPYLYVFFSHSSRYVKSSLSLTKSHLHHVYYRAHETFLAKLKDEILNTSGDH